MKLQSLGHKSELIFTSFDGQADDRGDYIVVRTLSNPNYFWGNLLIFDRPPVAGDLERWQRVFRKEFTDPRIYHQTFAWESAEGAGETRAFTDAGFELQAQAVMSATRVHRPPKLNDEIEIRIIQSPAEWANMAELQVASADGKIPDDVLMTFYLSQNQRFQKMEAAGMGHWYGAFVRRGGGASGPGVRLVAALGIFHKDGLGRFQSVVTHPDFRRQGICGTLVHAAAQDAFAKMAPPSEGEKTLVMCADPGYHALKIYESVGFETRQTEYGVSWWDRDYKEKSNRAPT